MANKPADRSARPMKKKGGGPLAGIPRQSGERSPTGNGAASNMDDNDDYCCACGGIGDLVCCDGCTRSFHFNCVDPPMKETALPDEWFCKVCAATRYPSHDSDRGLFGSLNSNLAKKNPISFHLPKDIREYFVDVKTGAEGEYDEGIPPKPKRPGYEETPDYFRLKDSKGKTILCHQCHLAASAPDRSVIPCAYCGLYWHMDCLEVPLAKEPGPGRFRCPAHIDDLLMTLPHTLAPAHRFRKIKGASAIRPAVSRGIQNNGHIEIENDPTDDEKELGFYEQREYGHVYKLPEMGIKLDFISQVRRKTAGKGGYAPVPATQNQPPQPRTTSATPLDQRSLLEQQAVLNLVSLAIPYPDLGNPQMLINALLAEASPAILALIAQGDASNLGTNQLESSRDRNALVALRALIDSKLQTFEGSPVLEEAAAEMAEMHQTTAAAQAEAVEEAQDENEAVEAEELHGAGPSEAGAAAAAGDRDTEMSDELD